MELDCDPNRPANPRLQVRWIKKFWNEPVKIWTPTQQKCSFLKMDCKKGQVLYPSFLNIKKDCSFHVKVVLAKSTEKNYWKSTCLFAVLIRHKEDDADSWYERLEFSCTWSAQTKLTHFCGYLVGLVLGVFEGFRVVFFQEGDQWEHTSLSSTKEYMMLSTLSLIIWHDNIDSN